jgi:hypothetical protein
VEEHAAVPTVDLLAIRVADTRRALAAAVAPFALHHDPADRIGLHIWPAHPNDDDRLQLHDRVRDHTIAMQAANEHPEVALRDVKQVVREVAPNDDSNGALEDSVARWCIAAYFEPR